VSFSPVIDNVHNNINNTNLSDTDNNNEVNNKIHINNNVHKNEKNQSTEKIENKSQKIVNNKKTNIVNLRSSNVGNQIKESDTRVYTQSKSARAYNAPTRDPSKRTSKEQQRLDI